jgi:hypothetical protein
MQAMNLETEHSPAPPRIPWIRIADTVDAGALGAACGMLLAAFGSAINSSTGAVGTTILAAGVLGGWAGRLPGAVVGAICGGLLVAFGSVVGGSADGRTMTALSCAVLFGGCRWLIDCQKNQSASPSRDEPLSTSPDADGL